MVYHSIRTIVVFATEKTDVTPSTQTLLETIRNGGYAFLPATGDDKTKNLYVVFNMSLETAEVLCRRYHQTSFVYTLSDACDIHGKFQIPLDLLESADRLFTKNIQHMIEVEKERGNHDINEERILDHVINHVGFSTYLWRKAVTKGFYDNLHNSRHNT